MSGVCLPDLQKLTFVMLGSYLDGVRKVNLPTGNPAPCFKAIDLCVCATDQAV